MKSEKIIAIICIIIMFAIGFGTLIADNKEPELSSDENRMLQGMPSLSYETVVDGIFAEEFENYMIDRIPFRKLIIGLQSSIAQSLSVVTLDDTLNVIDTKITQQMENMDIEELETEIPVIIETTPAPQITPTVDETTAEITLNATPTPEPTATPDPDYFSGSKYKSIGFIENETGTKRILFSFETADVVAFTDNLINLNNLIPEDGNLTFVFALESSKARPAVSSISQGNEITMFDEAMDVLDYYVPDNVSLISAPVLFETPLNNGEQMYFFTDHHWTVEGIHYAYTEAMNKIGVEPVKWEDYNVTYEYPFRGAYYRKKQATYYIENPDTLAIIDFPQADTFTHYLGGDNNEELPILQWDAPANDRYRVYYDGPEYLGPLSVIETTSNTGKNGLVIIDSYGIPFSCMLIPHYDTLCIVDLRYMYKSTEKYYIDDIMEKYDVDDVFVVLGDLNTYGSYYNKSLNVYMTNPDK